MSYVPRINRLTVFESDAMVPETMFRNDGDASTSNSRNLSDALADDDVERTTTSPTSSAVGHPRANPVIRMDGKVNSNTSASLSGVVERLLR